MLPAVPLVFLTFLLPESPRWLMIQGREEESLQTLGRLHARGNINDTFVQGEFDLMRRKVLEEAALDQSWGLVSTFLCSNSTPDRPCRVCDSLCWIILAVA